MKTITLLTGLFVMVLLPITAGAQDFVTNGLVAFYPFKGTANDAVGTNNGVIYGGVTLAPDRFGSNNSAYLFNGVDGYIDIRSPAGNDPTNLTETAWVNILSRNGDYEPVSPSVDVLISKRQTSYVGSGWPDLGVIANGPDTGDGVCCVSADYYLNNCVGAPPTETNVWFCVGEVISNDTYQIYINGVLENTVTDTHPLSSAEDMTLMHCGAWFSYINGLMDDVRIYNRPLSSAEMSQLYALEAAPLMATTATAVANETDGFVVQSIVTYAGSGYTNVPPVRFIGGGGSGAQGVAVVSNGMVIAINMISAGAGYINAPVVVIDPPFFPNPGLNIAPVSLLIFSNLTVNDSYQLQQFQGWYWTNLPVGIVATNTAFTYSAGPGEYRLALNPVPVQAFATAQTLNGFVVGANVTAGGSGYVAPPAVNIIGDVGNGATAVASVSGGVVTAITITDAGIDYTNLVTVQIDPPPATALLPTIAPGIQLNSSGLVPYDNYQVQFATNPAGPWENWNGGLFNSTNGIGTQIIPIANSAGFFRLEYVP